MHKIIIETIDSLPPLPQTIIDIEEFKKRKDREVEDLIRIIKKDPLCVTTLLKISNSTLFGFNSKIETVSRIINLLGMNFTIYVAISESINNILKNDLLPYGIKCEDYMRISNLSLSLVNRWLPNSDRALKDEILLGALLQESGKFILSEIIVSKGLIEEFKERLKNSIDTTTVEKEVLNITTSEITAQIFKHWKLSPNLIKMIEHVDNLEQCEDEYKHKAEILDVIKTICNVCSAFSDESITKGLEKAKTYGLDVVSLKNAIIFLKDRLDTDK